MPPRAPDPIDRHVGNRIRMRRIMMGLSQQQLGDAIGVTFQQVQKNEKGTNRISASRLQKISEVLQVPISFFFDGRLGEPTSVNLDESYSPEYVTDFLSTSASLTLMHAFMRISDPKLRRSIAVLVEQIAARMS